MRRDRICCNHLLSRLAVPALLGMAFAHVSVSIGLAATGTSFTPTGVTTLPATITVSTADISQDTLVADISLVFPSTFSVSNLACVGVFSGASPVLGPPQVGPDPDTTRQSLGCVFTGTGEVSSTTGNVLEFMVSGSGSGTVSFVTTGPFAAQFVHRDLSTEGIGTPGNLTVGAASAAQAPAEEPRRERSS